MKKQINPTIKAQILRSAFILLSLVAVCAIPFSLAQRNTTKRSAANPAAKRNLALVPTATGLGAAVPSTGAARPLDKQALAQAKQASAAAKKSVGAPASLVGGAIAQQRKADTEQAQAPKFPYSSIRTRGRAPAAAKS